MDSKSNLNVKNRGIGMIIKYPIFTDTDKLKHF